jgi:hypothetical protein
LVTEAINAFLEETNQPSANDLAAKTDETCRLSDRVAIGDEQNHTGSARQSSRDCGAAQPSVKLISLLFAESYDQWGSSSTHQDALLEAEGSSFEYIRCKEMSS